MKTGDIKILIIRLSSIGDIVLTTPVIRCIKTQLPQCRVHYLTKSSFKTVLQANPYIDKLHLLGDDLSETVELLKQEHFDYIIDLHKNLRTLLIKSRLGVKASSFNKLNLEKWILVNFKKNILPPVHIVDRYIKAAEFLGIRNDEQGLDYFLESTYTVTDLLPGSHLNYTALVIGAQHSTKRLPQHKLIHICRNTSQPIILLGGKEDAARGEEISLAAGTHVFNGCGKFTLDQSAFLVKMADLVITHDTGLMHIAAAFKKKVISVWGNTVPEFGMYPYRTENRSFEVKPLWCRPCSKIGYKKCPLGHFKCMNDQDTGRIAELTKTGF